MWCTHRIFICVVHSTPNICRDLGLSLIPVLHTHTLHARTRTHTDVGEAVTIEQLMDGMMLMDHSRDSLDVRACDVSSFDAELMDALEGERVRCESVVSGEEENPSGVTRSPSSAKTDLSRSSYA